ncbi:unnamed protein product [Cylindrotheca closterium]|uniref:Transmembrane protein n=1 Tax=Cylindrotheca closterium TaxID=2856 RepID=A0AAD2JGH4_9STRA|nr:unnamed protein product [Cylindrotheca closterium]
MSASSLPRSPSPAFCETTTEKDDDPQDPSTTDQVVSSQPSPPSPPSEEAEPYEELHSSIHHGNNSKCRNLTRALWQSSALIAYTWFVCTVAVVITALISPPHHLALLVYSGLSMLLATLMMVVEVYREDFYGIHPVSPKIIPMLWNPRFGNCCNFWIYCSMVPPALTMTVMKLEISVLLFVVLNLLRLCIVFRNHWCHVTDVDDDSTSIPETIRISIEPTAEDSLREPLLASDDTSADNV